MKKDDYKVFKKMYLEKFRGYYRSSGANKKELKRSVFENKNLNEKQKASFWELVVAK